LAMLSGSSVNFRYSVIFIAVSSAVTRNEGIYG